MVLKLKKLREKNSADCDLKKVPLQCNLCDCKLKAIITCERE